MSANTVVRTNVLSLNSHRNLGLVANQQARASQRLSSGFRINSAADDAAGLGISEKMRAQIRGLDQASRNGADGISLIQTAEGALDTVNEILIRVRELVIQASNDTNVGGTGAQSDRLRIQDEIDQLMEEIDAISTRTEFNTRTLLDGQLSFDGTIRGGEWTTVQQVRTTAPARVDSLDQFLRATSNTAFEGSFEALLSRIGADLQGMDVNQWMSTIGNDLRGLERAIDIAMGVDADIAGTTAAQGEGRWAQLETARGLTFSSARDLLNSFVQGLKRPNAMHAPGTIPAGSPVDFGKFSSWADFLANSNPNLSASTFANAESVTGGIAIYQALINEGFQGLTSSSTYSDVRNLFYHSGGGWANGIGDLSGPLQDWLATKFSDVVNPALPEAAALDGAMANFSMARDAITLAQQIRDSAIATAAITRDGAVDTAAGTRDAAVASANGVMVSATGSAALVQSSAIGVANSNLASANSAANSVHEAAVSAALSVFAASSGLAADEEARDIAINVANAARSAALSSANGVASSAITAATTAFATASQSNLNAFNSAANTATSAFNSAATAANSAFTSAANAATSTFNAGQPARQVAVTTAAAALGTARDNLNSAMAEERWSTFVTTYLTAETDIVQREVWVGNEAERERGNALWFQIGANSGQGINLEIGSMSTGSLFGREGANHTQDRRIIDVLDVFGYNVQDGTESNYGNVVGGNTVDTLLEAIDAALSTATRQRSELGAVQNRLEFAIQNLDVASENLSAANSRIRDADMAREMMSLTQANVLQQAAISMLAQANQAPQSVLQLLG